jgi:hypothetical protein
MVSISRPDWASTSRPEIEAPRNSDGPWTSTRRRNVPRVNCPHLRARAARNRSRDADRVTTCPPETLAENGAAESEAKYASPLAHAGLRLASFRQAPSSSRSACAAAEDRPPPSPANVAPERNCELLERSQPDDTIAKLLVHTTPVCDDDDKHG